MCSCSLCWALYFGILRPNICIVLSDLVYLVFSGSYSNHDWILCWCSALATDLHITGNYYYNSEIQNQIVTIWKYKTRNFVMYEDLCRTGAVLCYNPAHMFQKEK